VAAGSAAFFVRGFATTTSSCEVVTTTSSLEVVDPDEQAVAVKTNAATRGKDIFLNFIKLLGSRGTKIPHS
jgi:hypothetical protein